MAITKVHEAIAELLAERERVTADIDRSIAELRVIAARHSNGSADQSGLPIPTEPNQTTAFQPKPNRRSADSYIALALDVLQKRGEPMHAKDIATHVAAMKGASAGVVTRASVEGALVRAIKQKYGGVQRTGPSIFAVRASNAQSGH